VAGEIERMLTGPLQVDRPALLDQVRIEKLTRELIAILLDPPHMRSEALQAHARLFFADFGASGPDTISPTVESLAAQLGDAGPSVQDYLAYVLLDFAAADPALGELAVAHAMMVADALGIRARFEEKATKELKLNRKRLAALREESRTVVTRAATEGSAP
jgi:hypothetical protein